MNTERKALNDCLTRTVSFAVCRFGKLKLITMPNIQQEKYQNWGNNITKIIPKTDRLQKIEIIKDETKIKGEPTINASKILLPKMCLYEIGKLFKTFIFFRSNEIEMPVIEQVEIIKHITTVIPETSKKLFFDNS